MEYDDSDEAKEFANRARDFMDEVVIPAEREHPGGEPISQATIDGLREVARKRGVYCPQMEEEWGGGGVSFRDVLPLFEEAGRTLLGPPSDANQCT